ncbi:MAG: hypothetical protein DRO14_02165 [Thermoprotei archaeon]|nr:MAG: hypothetical protein DRO14_02165 [Thermoprotei archaeon]
MPSVFASESRGGFSWFLKIFDIGSRKKLNKSKAIVTLIARLETAIEEIKNSLMKLRNRYNKLMRSAINAYIKGERDRALIYANEMLEVRKILKKLTVSEMALVQVKLRLETIEDVSSMTSVMAEATALLGMTKDYVRDAMPSLAYSIESILSEARSVIAETTGTEGPEASSAIHYSPEAVKFLKELESMAEERVAKQLPEPPISLIRSPKPSMVTIKGITLPSQGMQLRSKPVRHGARTRTVTGRDLESRVLEYIVMHGGFIDISDAAKALGVTKEEVMEALNRLKEMNKITF